MSLNHSPSIVTDGLVLCLDAANKRSYPGTGTVWTDRSLSVNDGTLTNGPTFDAGNGGGIVFDGTNDYVEIANSTGSAFNLANISVGCWFKSSTSSSSTQYLVGKLGNLFSSPSQTAWYLSLSYSNGYLAYHPNGATGLIARSAVDYKDGNWHYAVGIRDDNANTLKMYVDGDLKHYSVAESNKYGDSTSALYIAAGGSLGSVSSYSEVSVACVHIYDKVLDDSEVRQNYEATIGRYT